ncbi:9-O-acetylesterase [Hymenobacter busanensis]|uniref:9-O-acetylesterase n=1 Tax=Hymenobacter busanensis TaxID=2607656 RepID=A0A7L4ZTZ7_9BACT|nr:sialate O-acetylesterase [Hymenobacter busanensis]KAA9339375.1 9-O-acetylesterase [Hymenobacter busanensis]QHJ06864.1 9-O-acetylesterase [Hymenobacter busanensis]
MCGPANSRLAAGFRAWRSVIGWVGLLLTVLGSNRAAATVRLPALVGSHMVLQRDAPLPIWGWADAGEPVTVTFRGQRYNTAAAANGRWQVSLPGTPAGGPYTLTISGQNTLELTDVLVGDVWLASGQSNMEWALRNTAPAPEQAVAQATYPNIRLFRVDRASSLQRQTDVRGPGWQVCSPASATDFSAVAYYFGRALHTRYRVPIGLVASCWGGTPAEAWMSYSSLRAFPEFRPRVDAFEQTTLDVAAFEQAEKQRFAQWQALLEWTTTDSLSAEGQWLQPNRPPTAEPTLAVPALWETTPALARYDGILWLRRTFNLPATAAGQPATLSLGPIDDADVTWLNGRRIGRSVGYDVPRLYSLPAGLLRAGVNEVVVRVADWGGGGGLWGKPTDVYLETAGTRTSLAGDWNYRLGRPVTPIPLLLSQEAAHSPGALFNAMIAPLVPFALKGVIWYQGESNAGQPTQYRTLFPALIQDWRRQWNYTLPFLFVQLPNFGSDLPQPADYAWAELRDAQAQALKLPRTGMAVTIDLGDSLDIHPRNKLPVGERLALLARRLVYGEASVVASGPTLASWSVQGSAVHLTFTNTGSGLEVRAPGKAVRGFAVAGPNRRFYWAEAQVLGNKVVLHCPQVAKPVAVRYNWGNSPRGRLYNKEGLPAAPFRTDTWLATKQ